MCDETAVMHLHGTHRHTLQASLGKLQDRIDDGVVNLERIVCDLVADGHDSGIWLEVVHTSWLDLNQQYVISETVRLRNCLREFLNSASSSG